MTGPILAVFMTAGLLAFPGVADAQRQGVQAGSERSLPLCRNADPGERCRTRNGTIRVRPARRPRNGEGTGQAQPLGGGDPGWQVRRERREEFGGDEPSWVAQPNSAAPGPAAGGQTNGPEPTAMECEFCDDDEDVPQGPIDNTPRPDTPAPQEPEGGEDDDCEWRNPAGGPDQEFCDE